MNLHHNIQFRTCISCEEVCWHWLAVTQNTELCALRSCASFKIWRRKNNAEYRHVRLLKNVCVKSLFSCPCDLRSVHFEQQQCELVPLNVSCVFPLQSVWIWVKYASHRGSIKFEAGREFGKKKKKVKECAMSEDHQRVECKWTASVIFQCRT